MKIWCDNCGERTELRLDYEADIKTKEKYTDVCCSNCSSVICSIEDHIVIKLKGI